ncbi:unnamed protein product [Cuscuta europaea]|uniref:Thioredoxin domain-containing protein n=1 Tax=Cuscuta europaea TaxID=41803 RepID=A0A9P0YIZ9_CUSEU|nr:unnamed protein product [Cuscuta europaea]
MGGVVKEFKSKEELNKVIADGSPAVVHFWATWCEASKHMDQVFSHLSTDFPHTHFLRVEAEEQPEISDAYSVSAVPYFVFFKDGKTVDTMEGADPSALANKVSKLSGKITPGEPAAPASLGMAAGATIIETVQNLAKDNATSSQVESRSPEPSGLSATLKTRLEGLVNSGPVMLFMKGKPEEPKCGFSRKVVDILKHEKIDFKSFDILTDDEVRQGLKVYSNWSSYPQLYLKGELIGGSDIVLEMQKSGELKKVLLEKGIIGIDERLKELVSSSTVMLFMKGSPDAPRCGFSSKVVKALNEEGVEFGSFDILTDEEVREGLKTFSNWPTYPQLYYNGELIGGCDIILELKNNGELKSILSE